MKIAARTKIPALKVMLRNRRSHQFFAGAGQWGDRASALDFERPEHAARLAKASGLPDTEIVLEYTNEPAELCLGLGPPPQTANASRN